MILVGAIRVLTGNLSCDASHGDRVAGHPPLGAVHHPARLRLGVCGAHRRRGHQQRRHRLRKPEAENASKTLPWMAGLLVAMFLGITFWPTRSPSSRRRVRTVVPCSSPPGSRTHHPLLPDPGGHGPDPIGAANTSFDLPRLANLIARDRLPQQFALVGDRLVYAVGIQVLVVMAGILIVARAQTPRPDPCMPSGSLCPSRCHSRAWSSTGKAQRLAGSAQRPFQRAWGVITTALVLIVVTIRSSAARRVDHVFADRAPSWHCSAASTTTTPASRPSFLLDQAWPTPMRSHTIIVLVDTLHRGVVKAIRYAQTIAGISKPSPQPWTRKKPRPWRPPGARSSSSWR